MIGNVVAEHWLTPLIWGIRLPYQLRWEYVLDNREWFIDGLILALKLALVGLAFGSVIGIIGAFLRSSGNKLAESVVTAYVELIRNVPLLLLVFIFHFGLPQAFPRRSTGQELVLDLLPTPERTFMVALSIYAGAYLTEIFRAGIMSVGRR
jgi:polar amino acid transport system permease protein